MSLPIQIVDEQDRPIGQASKEEAWAKGLIHRVIRIMLEDGKGNVLLQHRTPTKDIFPNCWDNSVAGHVDAREDYDQAARRELAEEIQVKKLPLTKIGNYRSDETWNGRRFNRFTACYNATIDFTPKPGEPDKIDAVRWFSIADAKKLIQDHPDQVTDGLRQVMERYY
jgi:isopentenyl-diphosphate delta-isomerase type 1